MPQEPKKRHSRQRQGKRRASIRFALPTGMLCPNCHKRIKTHAICKNCGYYDKEQVISPKVKKEKKEKSD